MSIDLLITIIVTSTIQSIFGTGVLLFGTPILLILGYDFFYLLGVLLPISVLINVLQLNGHLSEIKYSFYKKLIYFSAPVIIISLYFSYGYSININVYIGFFLILIAIKDYIPFLKKSITYLLYYETLYLAILGFLHGLTNLGGSMLSGAIFNKKISKEGKRATIAICYLSMALIQILTLFISGGSDLFINISNYPYWLIGPITFLIIEKFYSRIDEKMYNRYSNIFLALIGLVLVAKNYF